MVSRKSVLFVCLGNACRSQMAEAFARTYGSDVLAAASAGLSPAYTIPELTRKVMEQKNISLDGQFPKDIDSFSAEDFDLVVNLSGRKLPAAFGPRAEEWPVRDPIGESEDVYVSVRDQIENRVMRLILSLRRNEPLSVEPPPAAAPPSRRKFLR